MVQLMLISCSSRKSSEAGVIPALERYQGTTYKVIKKAKREGYWPEHTHLFIISAKYGLISEHYPIEFYDLKMTKDLAVARCAEISRALDKLINENMYSKIFVNMGETYMRSIQSSAELIRARQDGTVQEASGGIGDRLKQTKDWLLSQR